MKIILLSAIALCAQNAHAQTAYLMACRSVAGGAAIMQSEKGKITLSTLFTKGTVPADQGIPKGVCTWMDRGLSNEEPRTLSYDFPAQQSFTMLINLANNTAMSTGSVNSPDFNPIIEALTNLRYDGYVKYFRVYNVNNKFFKVVSVGP